MTENIKEAASLFKKIETETEVTQYPCGKFVARHKEFPFVEGTGKTEQEARHDLTAGLLAVAMRR